MATLEQVTAVGLKNILLSTDFSTASAHALAHAITLARHYHAKLHIVHVLKSPAHEGIPLDLLPELDRKHQEAEAAMLGITRTPELQDISHDVWLQAGPIWNALSSLIENTKIDLLVLGTSGREGLKKLLMGSVAEEVFRRAACPVLTVGPQVTAPSGTTTELKRILFPTDFSLASIHALPYAISLAEEHGAILTLLHMVVPFPVMDMGAGLYSSRDIADWQERSSRDCIERLRDLMPRDTRLRAEPEYIVEFGYEAEYITGIAAEKHADLIVMGIKRASFPRTTAHVPWRIGHQVVCHAPCPVLTIKSSSGSSQG